MNEVLSTVEAGDVVDAEVDVEVVVVVSAVVTVPVADIVVPVVVDVSDVVVVSVTGHNNETSSIIFLFTNA